MGVEAARIYATVGTNMAGFEAGMARASTAVGSVGSRMDSLGSRASRIGRSMTRFITLPVLGVAAAAGKMAFDFDESMTNIQALVGASSKQMKEYHDGVLSMARDLPVGPRELADALYFVTSSGFQGAAAMRVLKASAMAAAAGLGSTKTVADAVTSAVNAYGEKSLSASRATDILVAAVREGKAEPEELAAAIGRVIAPAEAMGVSFGEVSGAVAALSTTGLDAAEAVTSVRGLLMGLMKPAKQTRAVLDEAGLSVDGIRRSIADKGLLPTLQMLRDRFGANKDALGALFPNVRALNGFLALTGKNAKKNADIMGAVARAHGDTAKAFAKAMDSDRNKAKQAWSSIQADLIKLGGAVLPIVALIVMQVSRVVDAFTNLPRNVQLGIVAFVGLLAVIGPIVGAVGALISAVGGLVLVFGFLISPVGLIILAIAGLVAGLVYLFRTNQQVHDAMLGAWNSLRGAISAIVATMKAIWQRFGDDLKRIANLAMSAVVGYITGELKVLQGIFNVVGGLLRGDWSRVWTGIKQIASGALQALVSIIRGTVGIALVAATALGKAILDGVVKLVRLLAGKAHDAVSHVISVLRGFVGAALAAGAAVGKAFAGGVIDGIKSLGGAIKGAAESVVGGLKNLNPFSPVSHGGYVYVGQAFMNGAVRGIRDGGPGLWSAATTVVRRAGAAANGWAQIEGRRVGRTFAQSASQAISLPVGLQVSVLEGELGAMVNGDVSGQIAALQQEAVFLSQIVDSTPSTSQKHLDALQQLVGVNQQIQSLTQQQTQATDDSTSAIDGQASAIDDVGTSAVDTFNAMSSGATNASSVVTAAMQAITDAIKDVSAAFDDVAVHAAAAWAAMNGTSLAENPGPSPSVVSGGNTSSGSDVGDVYLDSQKVGEIVRRSLLRTQRRNGSAVLGTV